MSSRVRERLLQGCAEAPHRCPAEAGPHRCCFIPPPSLLGPAGSSRGQSISPLCPSPLPLQPCPGGGSLPAPPQCPGESGRFPAQAEGSARLFPRPQGEPTAPSRVAPLSGLGEREGGKEGKREGSREGGKEGGSSVRGERLRRSAGRYRQRQLLPRCAAGGDGSQRGGSAPLPETAALGRGAQTSAGK